jgi:hypothetical protein
LTIEVKGNKIYGSNNKGAYVMKKVMSIIMAVSILLLQVLTATDVFAEGTKDITADSGQRPYSEQYNYVFSLAHTSVMHVYLRQGEKLFLGTSVSDAKLYNDNNGVPSDWLFSNSAMGENYNDAQLAYINTADIYVAQGEYSSVAEAIGAGKTPGKQGIEIIDIPADAGNSTPGYIYDRTQEKAGADISGSGTGYKTTDKNTISSSTDGYVEGTKTNANIYTADEDGIYTVIFFSSSHTDEEPLTEDVSDTTPFAETQGSGSVASWDISVYNNGTLQTGRVFTNMLCLNTGSNAFDENGSGSGALYSKLYVVSDDGYQYLVDLNGLDASEFLLYANRQGMLSTGNGSSSSLMHSVRSNYNTFSDLSDHNIDLNFQAGYNIFFEKPSEEALNALQIGDPTAVTVTSSDITDFTFTGEGDTNGNEGYAGKGGTFSFSSSNESADSYQIILDFSSIGGGKVILSNELTSGLNSIYWNGKDANDNYVPSGTYGEISMKLINGETHIPLLDAEQNPNGIRIIRQNGEGTDEEKATVYYNNSAFNAGDESAPWNISNWSVGDGVDATEGVDSSDGAMKFTNENTMGSSLYGDGDKAVLDIWTYGSSESVSLGSYSFSLLDTSFTENVSWDNTAGTPAAGNPSDVILTLKDENGDTVSTDVTGSTIKNPVTLDTSESDSYTWTQLIPGKNYQAEETPVAGYTTLYSNITENTPGEYAQTVTNTYGLTSLTLKCIWNMNGGTDMPDEVKIHVYSDSAKQNEIDGSPFTLHESDNWTLTVSNLDPTLTYYAFQDSVDGYVSSTGGKVSGNVNDGFTSTFTDTREDDQTVISQVLVQWTNGNSNISYRPDSVLVTLCQDGKKVIKDAAGNTIDNPVELSESNDWYYAWQGLAKKDDSGNVISYTFSIASSDGDQLLGYNISTEPEDPPLVLGNLTSIIYDLDFKTTSFTVNEDWSGPTTALQPYSTTVQLLQSKDEGESYTNYGNAVEATEDDNWSYQWTGLPAYTSKNTQIQYYAVESAPDGYIVSNESSSGDVEDGYVQTFLNTYPYTTVSVTDESTGKRPDSTRITLYGNGDPYDICNLNASDNWNYTFTDLPINDENGNEIVYTVEQSPVTSYTTSGGTLTGSAGDGYEAVFKNTYMNTDFKASVSFTNGINVSAPSSVQIQLEKSTDGGKNYTDYGEPVTLNASEKWSYQWTELPAYNYNGEDVIYKASETVPAGYSASAGDVVGTVLDGYTQTISNTYDYTKVTVSDISDAKRPDSTEVILNKNGTAYKVCTLSASDNWTYVFENLPITDENGKTNVYTLEQSPVTDYTTEGGSLSGNASEGYTASFKNTYAPVQTSTTPLPSASPDNNGQDNSNVKTGDSTDAVLWSTILLISCGSLTVLLVTRKRNSAFHK